MAEPITYAVEREETATHGRYVVHITPDAEGEMTFRRLGDNTILIDHTGVPRPYRNTGIAQQLVDRMIADARAEGIKVVPLCSYVAAQFKRHPEWADLLAD